MTTSHITSADSRAPISPYALLASLARNWDLIWQMTKREVVGRYKGSILGLFWSFFHPLLMLAVYTFAFSFIFKIRIRPLVTGTVDSTTDFAFYCFTGMIIFTIFAEVVARAPSIILQHPNYVTKVVFPLEVFPFVLTGAAIIHSLISVGVLLLGFVLIQHTLHITFLLLPLILIPHILFILGFSWFLASLGVYLRDVAQTISIVIMIMTYLSPVFYATENIKEPAIKTLILLNPLTIPIENARHILLEGVMPEWSMLGIHSAISLLICCLGFAWFQRTKRGFADVL